MTKSNMLLSFLQKNCKIVEPIPVSAEEQFDFYKRCVNKLPKECVTENFLKIEDIFLTETLKSKTIISVKNQTETVMLKSGEACEFSADAVLSFLNEGNDKSVYLYGGTRLKNAVALALRDKEIAITKANNVFYSGIISAVLPKIDLKLTSVILKSITDKYIFALEKARENNLKSLVLCLPHIENPIVCSRVADAIINAIKQQEFYKNFKILLLAPDEVSQGVYISKIEVLKNEKNIKG